MTAMTPIIMVCAWNIVLSAIFKQKTQSYMLFSLMRIVIINLKQNTPLSMHFIPIFTWIYNTYNIDA